MAKSQTSLNWTEINPDTQQLDAKKAYEAVQNLHGKAKAAREKLEALITEAAELPKTHRLVFSYKFGHLSVAVDVAKLKKPKKVGPKAVDFESLKAVLRETPKL